MQARQESGSVKEAVCQLCTVPVPSMPHMQALGHDLPPKVLLLRPGAVRHPAAETAALAPPAHFRLHGFCSPR